MKGSYILLIELEEDTQIEVGGDTKNLGEGFYTYFGSAFGPGGLKRIERHREVSRGERDVRHWHIDYLTGLESSRIIEAVKFPERDLECGLADHPSDVIDGFGCTDCGCGSHLGYFEKEEDADKFIGEMKENYLDS